MAHPDDDILGCGGLLAKYAGQGCEFRVVFLAEGTSCRYSDLSDPNVELEIKHRNQAGLDALSHLGIKNAKFYDLPCGILDQIPQLDINKIIEQEIAEFEPDTVFTHSENDTNSDHRIIFNCTLSATRPTPNNKVEKIYSYEVLSSSEWRFTSSFEPNYFEVLTQEQVEKKYEALACYKTELNEFPHPRSREGIYTLAKYRGMQIGCEFAEGFKLVRELRK